MLFLNFSTLYFHKFSHSKEHFNSLFDKPYPNCLYSEILLPHPTPSPQNDSATLTSSR